jgi:hypothetical protein
MAERPKKIKPRNSPHSKNCVYKKIPLDFAGNAKITCMIKAGDFEGDSIK